MYKTILYGQLVSMCPLSKRRSGYFSSYRIDVASAILETIARRPCTLDDLHRLLGIHVNEINKYLGTLETEGKITTQSLERGVFYELKHK